MPRSEARPRGSASERPRPAAKAPRRSPLAWWVRWLGTWSAAIGIHALLAIAVDRAIARRFGATPPDLWVSVDVLTTTSLRLGLPTAVVLGGLVAVRERLGDRPRARLVLPAGVAVAASLLAFPDLAATFAPAVARGAGWAAWAPPLGALALGLGAGAGAAVAEASLRGVRSRPRALGWAALTLAVGIGHWAADQTWLVAIYARLHAALELAGSLLVTTGLFLGLWAVLPERLERARAGFALALAAWPLPFAARFALDAERREAAQIALSRLGDFSYLAVRGAKRLEGTSQRDGFADERIGALLEQYGIDEVRRDPKWDGPMREPPELARALEALRPDGKPYSVLVFYVDTLRHDVAADPRTMPATVQFGSRALRFDAAYSCGSDTLTALPCLIGGHYDVRRVQDPEGGPARVERRGSHGRDTIIDTAREQGLQTALFLPESTFQFLEKLHPRFLEFHEVQRVSDHQRAGVWGYGADQPTADELVTRTLDWISRRGDERFFAWTFHFDVHNWREIDRQYLASITEQHGIEDNEWIHVSYRAAARGVDVAFQRLLDGLEQLGRADDTIVVFVSDHGEGLGEGGFWVHSVFLWESLIRVPLLVRIPDVPPRVIEERVSLVDVAPTLARYLHPAPALDGFHGEDLLSHLVPGKPPRRLPILASSVLQEQLARVAILDGRYKLVLKTDWGPPQLLDVEGDLPDDVDVTDAHPREALERMAALLSSPVFVNAYEDARARAARANE